MGTAIDTAFCGATLAACPLSALVLSFAFYGFAVGHGSRQYAPCSITDDLPTVAFCWGRVVLSMVWAALPAGCCCAGFRMPRASLSLQRSYAA